MLEMLSLKAYAGPSQHASQSNKAARFGVLYADLMRPFPDLINVFHGPLRAATYQQKYFPSGA